jgi:2-polyprenyl-6-hydroxyphenyl methylase/3-demethylubiquinone-9 3-methyltransferase
MAASSTVSKEEIARFDAQSGSWWDEDGPFRPLHRFNPPRLEFLKDTLARHFNRDARSIQPFSGLTLLDIGCGGGLIAEPMARLGFTVTGLDAGEKVIAEAKRHAALGGLAIDYRVGAAEDIGGQFDVVLAMEVIEHVADPSLFLTQTVALLKPEGALVAATLNRTLAALALAKIGAEYILGWLPKGTHDWRKFLRPSELAAELRRAGITPVAFEGVRYDPLSDTWARTPSLAINYMVYGTKT